MLTPLATREYGVRVTRALEDAIGKTREIARTVVAERSDAVDEEARWPEENFRELQRAGLGGLVVPTRDGGLGLGLLAVARSCEELGRICPSTGISWGMHHVGSAVIAAKATTEQRARYLGPIAEGKHFTTLALSEPGTGAHFYLPETRLVESGSSFVATGRKSFVTNGGRADSYVLSTAAVSEGDAGEFSCIVVPNDAEGLVWGAEWKGLGMRGNSSRDLELRDVRVPRTDLLGEEGDEIWYVFNVVAPFFLTAMAGTYVGVAAAALEEAVAHVSQRRHSHSAAPLANIAVVQHRVGELWARVARTRALIHHAAVAAEAATADALPLLCSAKAEVAGCAVDVVNDAMTLMGGRAYAQHSRIERLLRDARAAHVMAPTTDQLRIWTGRALLDLPLLAD